MQQKKFFKSFGENLHHHVSPPPDKMWNQIDQNLDQHAFDQLVKARMDQVTSEPPKEVWNQLEPRLPRHLFIRRYLRFASGIAAALVLGFGLQVFLNAYSTSYGLISLAEGDSSECLINTDDAQSPQHLGAGPSLAKERKIQKRLKQEKISLEDALLEELLMEEEDIVIAIDSALIRESLKPAKQPNSASAVASSDQDIELQISIPLQIVEEDEIEELLEMYERRNK